MAKSKLVEVNEKIAEGVTAGYKKIEEGFLTKEGESVEEAKARLASEQKEKKGRV